MTKTTQVDSCMIFSSQIYSKRSKLYTTAFTQATLRNQWPWCFFCYVFFAAAQNKRRQGVFYPPTATIEFPQLYFGKRKCIPSVHHLRARGLFHSLFRCPQHGKKKKKTRARFLFFKCKTGHRLGTFGFPLAWLFLHASMCSFHDNGRSTRLLVFSSFLLNYYYYYRGGVLANAAAVGAGAVEVEDSPAVMNGCSRASDDLILSLGS